MPYWENNGARLDYEDQGKGKPFIFLHGASWDLREWDHQVQHYLSNYRVITMDARGHGKSSLPAGKVSPDSFRQDVIALMDHLQIDQAILCGLSLGGHTSMQVAIYATERVERLILIGAPCSNSFNLYEKICVPINRFSMHILPMRFIAWSIAVVLGVGNPDTKKYIMDVVGSLKHNEFCRVWSAATSMESREGLPRINCPTLIMVGDHDSMTMRQQEFIHQSIKGSKLVIIKNAHHGTNLDNPAQVESEIDAFLAD